jgi:hypothetical protein
LEENFSTQKKLPEKIEQKNCNENFPNENFLCQKKLPHSQSKNPQNQDQFKFTAKKLVANKNPF